MSGRRNRKLFKELLQADNWRDNLPEIISGRASSVGPLFGLLPGDPVLAHRAACALGQTLAGIAMTEPEKARNAVRRFMWHMNEESGNIGWGIPEAFAETLAATPLLANEYKNILISYIMDLGHDDNYCDHDILRRSCYWAIGRLAEAQPELAQKARHWLIKGLEDKDRICRGMAAWALGKLGPEISDLPPLQKLASRNDNEEFEIYDDFKMEKYSVSGAAKKALQVLTA